MNDIVAMTFLTSDEINHLTGCIQKEEQIKTLHNMHVLFKVNKRKDIIILRDHLKEVLSLNPQSTKSKRIEPNETELKEALGIKNAAA